MVMPADSISTYRRRLHIACGLSVVAGLTALLTMTQVHFESLRGHWQQIVVKQRTTISQKDAVITRISELQDRQNALDRELRNAALRIPEQSGEDAFAEDLTVVARSCGLDVSRMRPDRIFRDARHDRITIQAKTGGQWASICRFLHSIEQSRRLCRLDSFRIAVSENDRSTLLTDLQVSIFSRRPAPVAEMERGRQ